jgi:hypothetical protein
MKVLHKPEDFHDFVYEVIDGEHSQGNTDMFCEIAEELPEEQWPTLRRMCRNFYLEGMRDGLRLMDRMTEAIKGVAFDGDFEDE